MTIVEVILCDICTLDIECIVNASNESGLGCMIPNHPCIDNAIHKNAGPGLLEECKTLGGVPTGVAKITKGHNLPAKYIIHVTGPRIDSMNHKEDHMLLAQCYINCLELAKKYNIRALAFCCISTGIYGYNKKTSSETAYITVMTWLSQNPKSIDRIVFNVFTPEDQKYYTELLESEIYPKTGSDNGSDDGNVPNNAWIFLIILIFLILIILFTIYF